MDDQEAKDVHIRQVQKSAPYHYMKIRLEFEDGSCECDLLQLKHIITQALTQVFGQVGSSDTIDMLKLSPEGEALLRVPTRCFVRLWSAMTLCGKYDKHPCAFKVIQVSSSLMALSSSSRQWEVPGVS